MFRIILIFFIIFFVACNTDTHKTDFDIIPDKDSNLIDLDNTQSDMDTSVIDLDIIDTDTSQDINEFPDTDADCLDLRYNENTVKTDFPFTDKNGKPTFCRPGCDIPTETDPQCVHNIWKWDNWEKYQEYLEAEKKDSNQDSVRACYPWPCVMPDMKGRILETMTSQCDKMLSGYGLQGTMGAVWSHGMSDGVAGMMLDLNAIEYDPEKDEFKNLGQPAAVLVYNRNRYIIPVEDREYPEENLKSFIVSIEKRNDKYYYELIYDNKDHNAFLSRSPFVGKDWVLIQVRSGKDGNDTDVKYAKAGEWEWHSLNIGKIEEGNIVDDRLSFIINDGVNDRQIFYCDLSKYPKSFNDCVRVTRKLESGVYELGHSPRIDENNKNRMIYFLWGKEEGNLSFVEVVFNGSIPEYKEYSADHLVQPEKVNGNTMLYASYYNNEFINCWYRFDKKKSYCPIDPWSVSGSISMHYGAFSGKWHLWRSTTLFMLRDWECYCKEEGICPFEE
ncbi:MAG TPA: hypothetical protein PLZ43_05580 [bacterium]|nr:hypothetical protein [bacterium]